MPENASSDLRPILAAQGAPDSQLQRIESLRILFERDPDCVGAALVGSYAQGRGDRISDLDLVAFTSNSAAKRLSQRAHTTLVDAEVLFDYAGTHGETSQFHKYIFLDCSSCELYVIDVPTRFKLLDPYLAIWNPTGFLETRKADGLPPRHEDFNAYQHGDAGLVWELFDCIKWLKRGRVDLTKNYLRKLAARI